MGKKERMLEFYRKKRERVREGEAIAGGFIVLAIDPESGRVMPPPVPFEHPSLMSAIASGRELAKENAGREFVVYGRVEAAHPEDIA